MSGVVTALITRFEISLPAAAKEAVHMGGLGFPFPEGSGHPENANTSLEKGGIETSVWNEAHIGGDHGFVEYVHSGSLATSLLRCTEPPLLHLAAQKPWIRVG